MIPLKELLDPKAEIFVREVFQPANYDPIVNCVTRTRFLEREDTHDRQRLGVGSLHSHDFVLRR